MPCRLSSRFSVLASALLVALAPVSLRAQSVPATRADSSAVVAAVTAFHAAMERGDSLAAMALLAPDVEVLESGGLEDRAEFRAHHLAADIEFARAVKQVRGAMRVKLQGDVAWTAATSTATGTFRGRDINSTGAESMVLTRTTDGRWLIRSIHWSSRSRRPASR